LKNSTVAFEDILMPMNWLRICFLQIFLLQMLRLFNRRWNLI